MKQSMNTQPYTANELFLLAQNRLPMDPMRVLATYADPDNWRGIYGGDDEHNVPQLGKNWASCGPVCPPWELAQNTLKQNPESVRELQARLFNAETALKRVGDLYALMRNNLAEERAQALHGAYQAAASAKSIEECRRLASLKLRASCPWCNEFSVVIKGEQGAQYQVACEKCDGTGFIPLPALEWMKNGVVQFALLPPDHPDYDPTKD